MNKHQCIVILDFGGQYNQLIARRVREENVYCEMLPYHTKAQVIKEKNPIGIIFTGGPATVTNQDAPVCDKEIFELGVPILGICYGMQLMATMLGGKVEPSIHREYGKADIELMDNPLFKGYTGTASCWMSHTYYVDQMPEGFQTTAKSKNCKTGAIYHAEKQFYGVQFHPEVCHTQNGQNMLRNFLFDVCKAKGDWKMSSYVQDMIKKVKQTVGDKKVLCALSGGVDSSVAAVMINEAVGKQLTCVFVDHGLLRKNEADQVEEIFKKQYNMKLIRVNAQDRFLNRLKGVSDPETKRKIIGEEFIRVFEEHAKAIGEVDYLVQGTIYPDVIESGVGDAAMIKSHHNVGGLPDLVDFKEIIEPLRDLFKDEVRKAGEELDIPEDIVWRQPFPGPGLAIRVIGEITFEKLELLRDVDWIFREEVKNAGLGRDINQYFAVLTDMRSVGVMGDERTYDYTVALRGVTTTDFMTADWARIPYDVLERVSNRIVNEVKHINRIVYDITSKPPATIEWE